MSDTASPAYAVGPADDADRFLATDQTVWFAEQLPHPTELQLTGIPLDQRFAAHPVDPGRPGDSDPTTYPGIYGVYPLTLAAPAPAETVRAMPCAGLTWVGVHPDHRRRGVLTSMLRHHFEQVRATPGTFISALHASEPAIYGRHGYGLATLDLEVTLSRGATLTAPGLDEAAAQIGVRLATMSDPGTPARMHACHHSTAQLGAVMGEVGYYQRLCVQLPEELRDKEPWRLLFAQRDGVDVGFAMFRRTAKWEHARPSGELDVWTIVGDPATRLALLRRLVDFDLIGSVKLHAGGDDPVLHWAGGPRATAGIETYDCLWIRLVDLPDALMARSYAAGCDVVLDVTDRSAPWNEGRWRMRVDDAGAATVERTDAEPDLRLPVETLGSAYLGAVSLLGLARAGLVTELRAGAAAELARAMRSETSPIAAVGF